jgi:hypothetical protein
VRGYGWLAFAIACNGVHHATPDAAKPDAAKPDAAVDAGPDAAIDAGPVGAHYHYVVNTLVASTSESQDALLHVDTHGNPVATGGTGVDKLGGLFAALRQASPQVDFQPALTADVDDGNIVLLVDLQTASLADGSDAGLQMFLGDDPMPPPCDGSSDTTCGHQFSGSATFGIALSSTDEPVLGTIAGSEFAGIGNNLVLPYTIALAGGSAGVVTLELHDAIVQASSLDATAIGGMVIGGAILETDVQSTLLPAIATDLNAIVTASCTAGSACGSGKTIVSCSGATPPHDVCCTGSAAALIGDNAVVGLDANKDCVITTQELSTNTLVAALVSPDVASTGNSEPDAVSFGTAATAVGAVFTVPGE